MRRLAIFSVLSKKIKDNELKIIDQLDDDLKKTKEWNKILKNLVDLRLKTLLIPCFGKKGVHRLIQNIKNVNAIPSHSLNVYDLLKHKNIVLEKNVVEEIEKHYTK
jgi:large subunit ribosomal protein L4